MLALALRFWPQIALAAVAALAALFFAQWQGARQDVGVWKERHRQAAAQTEAFQAQLKIANAKIQATAQAGATSYAHCQNVIANDAARSFDRGVLFGRSQCGSPSLPSASH